VSDNGHSQWGPSGAERWMVCHASVQESAKAPERPASEYAREGSHAHAVLEYCLLNDVWQAANTVGKVIDAKHGTVQAEMAEAVQECLDYVADIMATDDQAQIWVEVKVELPLEYNPGDGWGTSDVIIWLPTWRTLYVVDYKHGAGIAKDAEDNPQLKSYGAGALFGQPLGGSFDPLQVVLTIVQPRAFHAFGPVREWPCLPDTLLEWIVEYDDAVTATKQPNPQYVVDEDVCRFCDGAIRCKALEAKALSLAGEAFKDVRMVRENLLPAPEAVGMDHVAYVVSAGKVLKKWLSTFEDYATEQAMQGVYVPGHKLVAGQSRSRWAADDPRETAQSLIEMTEGSVTIDDVYPRTLVNMTEAEKLVKKPRPGEKTLPKKERQKRNKLLEFLKVKENSKSYTLVPESDRRPAVNPVQRAFAGVQLPPTQER
jgi:hypothetical protein